MFNEDHILWDLSQTDLSRISRTLGNQKNNYKSVMGNF